MNAMETRMVKSIKRQYEGVENSPLKRIKALDRRVKLPAEIFTYTFGIIGALVLGVGMCLAMKVIFDAMLIGVGIGLVGIGMVSINYPIYRRILKRRKNKFGEEILKLCSEIENS